jgi:palmitoyltransferase ZDHHC9/14/18
MSVSSHMTDDFTDYGEPADSPAGPNTAAYSALASRVPDPGSRPSSAQTGRSSKGNWSAATPHSRFPPTSYAGSVGGSAGTRPPTSQSRTHVPTLTAQAFYRPMSSQRLQAQRGQRRESAQPSTPQGRNTPELMDGREGRDTTPGASRSGSQRKHGRPLSRGTDISDLAEADDDVPEVPGLPYIPDRATATASPNGSESALKKPEKEKPSGPVPARLDLSRLKGHGPNVSPPQRSPRSFRSSLIPSRNSRQSRASFQGRQHGHEKLPSNASSPNIAEEQKAAVKKELGKNYEYFEGNTIFCLGGRLQNTRGRPINLLTGFLIILPIALFFVFS